MNKQSQQGMTTAGWIIVIAIFGSIVLTGFKIIPMYLEYFNVQSIMDGLAADESIDPRSKRDLWKGLEKRLQVNQINSIAREDVSFSRSKEGITTVKVGYDVTKPWIAQLYIGARFSHSVEIKR
jgi:Tfp pilus assembly major pilin PilA